MPRTCDQRLVTFPGARDWQQESQQGLAVWLMANPDCRADNCQEWSAKRKTGFASWGSCTPLPESKSYADLAARMFTWEQCRLGEFWKVESSLRDSWQEMNHLFHRILVL